MGCFPYDITLKKRKEGDILIVITKDTTLYFLNNMASYFVMLCNGINTVEDIVLKIYNEYDVQYEKLEYEIIDLIENLQKKRIIHIKDNLWI